MTTGNGGGSPGSSDAVSPVIGVVMIVAITVALSAVVGAMALGMGGQVDGTVNAAVNVEFDPANHEITVRVVSMQRADRIEVRMTSGSSEATANITGSGGAVRAVPGEGLRTMGAADAGPGARNWSETGEANAAVSGAVLPPLMIGATVAQGGGPGGGGPGGGPGGGGGGPPCGSPPCGGGGGGGGGGPPCGSPPCGGGGGGDTPSLAPSAGDTVTITVTAIEGDVRTVVAEETGQL